MPTLANADSISAIAGSASAITFTAYGDQTSSTSGADNFGRLAGPAFLPAVAAAIITASGGAAIVREIVLKNVTGSAVTFTMYAAGIAAVNSLYSGTIPANGGATIGPDGMVVYDVNGYQQYSGSTGPTGITGATGANAFSVTTAGFTMPSVAGTVTVAMGSSAWLAAGQTVFIATAGYFTVTSIPGGGLTAVLTNTGDVGNAAPTTVIATAQAITPGGVQGVQGLTGIVTSVTAADASITVGGTTALPTISRAALTGDITASAGSNATTLATVLTATPGSYGSAGSAPQITVNGKGLITAAASVAITPAGIGAPSGSGTSVGSNTGDQMFTASGDATASASFTNLALTLATVNTVTPGSYGSATTTPVISVNGKGLVTASAAATIAPPFSAVTGQATLAQLPTIGADTVLGSLAGGTPAALTQAQLTTLVNPATTALSGAMSTTDKIRMGQVYDAQADFGFVGDLRTVFDAVMNTGGSSTTLTCSTSTPFTSTAVDGGKRVTVVGAGASGAQLTTTIASVSSSSVAILTVGCSTSVSAKGCSFGTDNTTAISNMQTAVNSTNFGTKVIFGESATNAYGFPTNVILNRQVAIEGIGGSHSEDFGDYTRIGGTRLAWWGTSSDGGTPFQPFIFVGPASSNVQTLKGVSIRRCWIDGRNGDQNAAAIGLEIQGCFGARLEEFMVMDCLAISIKTTPSTTTSDNGGVARPYFNTVSGRMLETQGVSTTPVQTTTAVALTATAGGTPLALSGAVGSTLNGSGYAWVMTTVGQPVLVHYTSGGGTTSLAGPSVDPSTASLTPTTVSGANVVGACPQNGAFYSFQGNLTANTNCGIVMGGQISYGTSWGAAAMEFGNSDSMAFYSCFLNGGTGTVFATNPLINRVTKPGVRINGSNTNVALAARNITFTGGDMGSASGGGISAMGVTNAGTMMAFPSGPTYVDLYQLGNGDALPNVELGASFAWNANGSLRPALDNPKVSVGAQAITLSTTLQLVNGSSITIPAVLQPGFVARWTMDCTKSAAGTAARVWTVTLGATNTNADAKIATITNSIGTAVADTARFITDIAFYTTGASISGSVTQSFQNGPVAAATGFTTSVAGTGRIFQSALTTTSTVTSGLLYLNVWLSTATAGEVITFQNCYTEIIKGANP